MTHAHAVIWLDHRSARVVSFSLEASDTVEIESARDDQRLHRKSGIPGSGHAEDDRHLFEQVVAALDDVPAILIAGPGTAKKAFVQHLEAKHPDIARRVVGVETLDHPTHGELLAFGRTFFKRVDRLGLAPG
ncbi:MAG: translational machinery protein [Actinobacteria bacterium]|nr:translational machinery protein [Actinomycetota bacterium]